MLLKEKGNGDFLQVRQKISFGIQLFWEIIHTAVGTKSFEPVQKSNYRDLKETRFLENTKMTYDKLLN